MLTTKRVASDRLPVAIHLHAYLLGAQFPGFHFDIVWTPIFLFYIFDMRFAGKQESRPSSQSAETFYTLKAQGLSRLLR